MNHKLIHPHDMAPKAAKPDPAPLEIVNLVNREGITIIKDPQECQVDIVFVHGLNGHPYKSWANELSHFYWPLELAKIFPNARLMVFGYTANFSNGGNNQMGIRQHAESLILNLRNNRQKSLERPLVFVCHSLGGLITKQALVLSSQRQSDTALMSAIKLIVFFGTPHRGSALLGSKKLSILEKMAKAAFLEIPSKLKAALKPQADELFSMNEDFTNIKRDISIINFYEQKEMSLLGDLVVDKDSAVLHYENVENIPLHRDHRELIRFANADDDAYRQIHQTLGRKFSSILEASLEDGKGALSEIMETCLNSLRTTGHENRVSEIADPSENTLDWLWDDVGFMQWLTKGKDLHWISGKPGSGKSVLMKEISIRLPSKVPDQNCVTARHFFNSRGTSTERSFEGFLRSVLEQILQQAPDLFECMKDGFRKTFFQRRKDNNQWTLRSLKNALNDIVSNGSSVGVIYLIIDALDECEDMSMVAFRNYFKQLSELSKLMKIKVCFSSRFVSLDILSPSSKDQGFVLQEKNSVDIMNFVNDRWSSAVSSDGDSEDLREIKDEIIEKADGVFLWVRIVLSKMEKGLNDGNTVYELRESLKAIPRELSGLFGVLLDSIDAEYAEETNTMLSLILCSVQPLTLPEFRYAMAFCGKKTYLTQSQMLSSENVIQNDVTMIKRIRSRCGGLLETKASVDASNSGKGPSNMVVQFIHQSVKDYLSIRQESSSKILGSKELTAQGHKNFTQACLHYLSINDLRDLPSRLETLYHIPKSEKQLLFTKEFPFLNYSVSYWIQHYREAEIHGLSQWERLELFGQNNGVHFDTWCELRNWLEWFVISEIKQLFDSAGTLGPILLFDGDHMDTSIFQLAVNHNFLDYVRRALESGQEDANTHIKSWGSYLQLAAFRGHEEMVELLLRHDARVNAGTGGMTPLMAACFAGRAGTVRKLLEWEADVLSGGTFTNPLTAAAASGKWEIIEILLEHDKEIFQNGMYRHSALHTLSIFALWRRGFDYDDDDPEFTTEMVVFEEKKTDYAKIVDLLTAQGVEYEFFGPVAPWFQWLMISGSEKLVDTLAARGANLGIEDPQGVTLLHLAALGGNGEAVQSLVKNGANLFAQTKSGATIQHAAAANRVANALCYLLRLGLDPNVSDENETTPLHLAARNGSDIHLEALLSAGADPTTIDNKGCSPLHNAVANKRVTNDINILDALCPADSYINAWACNGLTPLHIAARHGSLSTVRWLVEKGADIHVVDEQDRTLLHAAAANKEDITADILDFLIGKGLDVAAVDDVGMTPLHNILYYKDGPFEYGRVLFGKEVDPFRSDVVAPSTFQACKARIRVLLSRGADMNAQDDSGSTLLHAACANSDRRVVKLLLEEGADKEIMDYRGCKPVDVAKRDEVRSLLELD